MRRFHDYQNQKLNLGLRRTRNSPTNQYGLFDLYNLRPTENGLAPYIPVGQVFTKTQLQSTADATTEGIQFTRWPFPQMFRGKMWNVVAGETDIYITNEEWSMLFKLDTYDATNTSSLKDIPAGGPWHFVDMQETFMLVNGSCAVLFPGESSMLGVSQKAYVSTEVPLKCAAWYKGRVVFGGLDFNHFWNSTWESFWTNWTSTSGQAKIAHGISTGKSRNGSNVMMPMEENFIWWSLIGGGDLLWLFFPALAVSGAISSTHDSSSPMLFDLWKRGDQGFGALQGKGTVQNLKVLGEYLIAYQDNAVIALRNEVEPMPTLSQRVLWQGTFSGTCSVAGDDNNHIFVDGGGNLIHIDRNLNIRKLGYEEFFRPMVGSDIMAHHVPNPVDDKIGEAPFGQFYFVTPEKTFVLNSHGLFETAQKIWSAHYLYGATMGIADDLVEFSWEGRIGIDNSDFGLPGDKQLDMFELSFSEDVHSVTGLEPSIQLAADYKMAATATNFPHRSHTDNWRTSEYRKFNEAGVVYLPCVSNEFRFRIKCDDFNRIEYIRSFSPTIKFIDKRYRRSASIDTINR